ncbi:MAG TPA: hypothetical protein DIS79_02775 [Bacteroidetes bacterium]|nr:hypothetical protein [Bacteroidota bacterium]HRK05160.1 hypothetical protein [Chlorobiota bacterium]
MHRLLACVALLVVATTLSAQQSWDPLSVDVTRALVKDLFQSNAVPYVQPMVTTINATSNAGFYNTAYIPKKDSFYVKVSVRGMLGFIRDDQKTYNPTIDFGQPTDNLLTAVTQYGTVDLTNRTFVINPRYEDTLGLTTLLVREVFIEARKQGKFPLPTTAPTLFGYAPDTRVYLPPNDTLLAVLRTRPDYQTLVALVPNLDSNITALLSQFALPPYLTLPPGADMSTLIAAVPQIELGSFLGTEILIRAIPPVEFDANVGDFSFWGLGLKHSISQYFPERWFDLAVQGVYQGTSLTNTVGFTGSKLEANARIFSGNIHASKRFGDYLDVFSGFSYERIDVVSTYTYVLPQEVQIALGLLPTPPPGQPAVPTPEQPGDNRPQKSEVNVGDTNLKWTIGATAIVGPVRIFVDYSVSQFNIFSGGVEVGF